MELEMLKTIIEKTLGRNMDAITEKTTFVDDLGVDSLDLFQILIDDKTLLFLCLFFSHGYVIFPTNIFDTKLQNIRHSQP